MLANYLIMCATLLFIGGIVGITPRFMRKNIHFGVMLPYDASEQEQVKNWSKQYFLVSMFTTFVAIAILTLVAFTGQGTTGEQMDLIAIVGSICMAVIGLLQLILYFVFHFKARKFKSENYATHEYKERERITVDTTVSGGNKPSFLWAMLIGAVLIVVTAAVPIIHFDNIPSYIPYQWAAGQVTAYREKSMAFFMMMPGIQVILMSSLFLANYVISNTKQVINPRKAVASSRNNQAYRQVVNRFLGLIAFLTIALMLFIQMGLVFGISPEPAIYWLVFGYIVSITLGVIYIAVKFGQGGGRLKEKGADANNHEMYDDDGYWILGMIYFNPKDPALFVEKRFGIGSTVNMGNKLSWVILGTIVLLSVVLPLLIVFLVG